jgi:Protein of unknown function (DUF3352)
MSLMGRQPTTMSRRLQLAAAAVTCFVAAVAAACGGTTKTGVSGESGASLLDSGALAYAAVDSDLGSSQWQQVDGLLKKFPGRETFLNSLRRGLASKQLDYDRDIKPALGPEVDAAVFVGSTPDDVAVVLLTKPDSLDKARELIRKLKAISGRSETTASKVVDGWLVVSDTMTNLERTLKGSGKSLADDDTFKDALGELPGDALAKVYVNGRQFADLADKIFGEGAQTTALGGSSQFGLDNLDWAAASIVAEDEGLKLEGDVKTGNGGLGGPPYTSKLISGVPADALTFASFHGRNTQDQLRRLRQNPAFSQVLSHFEAELGMRLDDVYALFEHETAFYVRRGPGLPEFSLVLEAPDTEQALTTIDRLATRLAKLAHAQLGADTEGSLNVKTLNFGRVTVRWAGFDGRVLLTTGPTGIADYRASGDKLADDSAYKDALDAAGAPDKTIGLFYVNLADGLELIKSYAGLAGGKLPPNVRENLRPLQSFVAFGSSSGDVTKLAAFLAIK